MPHKGVRIPVSHLEPIGCEKVFMCLPSQAVPILLSLSERLEWKTTWIDDMGQQQPLTDAQTSTIDAIIGGITDAMCKEDLINAIGEMMTVTVNNYVSCGCGTETAVNLTINNYPSGTYIPQPAYQDEPFAIEGLPNPAIPTADGYTVDEQKCRVANIIFDDILRLTSQAEFAIDLTYTLFEILQTISGIGVIKKAAAAAGDNVLQEVAKNIWDVFSVDGVTDILFGQARDYLVANKQSFICSIYQTESLGDAENTTAAGIVAAYLDGVTNLQLTPENLTVVEYMVQRLAAAYSQVIRWLWEETSQFQATQPLDCALCDVQDTGITFVSMQGGPPKRPDGSPMTAGETFLTNTVYSLGCLDIGNYNDQQIRFTSGGSAIDVNLTITAIENFTPAGSIAGAGTMLVKDAAGNTLLSISEPDPPVLYNGQAYDVRIIGLDDTVFTTYFKVDFWP